MANIITAPRPSSRVRRLPVVKQAEPVSGGVVETPLERILNDIGAIIWRTAKMTSTPLETQATLLEHFQDFVFTDDPDLKLQLSQKWLDSCGGL